MNSSKSNKSQADKFREAARELETDESEERFNERLKRIAKSPPPERDDKSEDDEPGQ
jgi:hypothetical protein